MFIISRSLACWQTRLACSLGERGLQARMGRLMTGANMMACSTAVNTPCLMTPRLMKLPRSDLAIMKIFGMVDILLFINKC